MKIITLILFLSIQISLAQSILISPNNGSKLIETNSTNKAVQIPTVAATTAITSPQKGMVVFDDATGSLSYYNGTIWVPLSNSSTGWVASGTNINNTNSGRVGIGTSAPASLLHVAAGDAGTVNPRIGTIQTLETNGTSGYLSILTPKTATAGVTFGSPDGNSDGSVNYDHLTQKLALNTKNSTKMTIDSVGNVGINDSSPSAKLDVNGDFALSKKVIFNGTATPQIFNSFDRQRASRLYINGGTLTINGIAGGVDGAIYYIYTALTTNLTINNMSPLASSSDRISTHTGGPITTTDRGAIILIYEENVASWRVISYLD